MVNTNDMYNIIFKFEYYIYHYNTLRDMRYIKATSEDVLDKIVCTAINIVYGTEYYNKDCVLLTKPKANYNTYMVDSVEYNIHPVHGFIYLLNDDSINVDLLENAFMKQFKKRKTKIMKTFEGVKQDMGTLIATRYIRASNSNSHTSICINNCINNTSNESFLNVTFTWHFYTNLYLYEYKIEDLNALSSIVVDTLDIFDLPNGYKSIEYPKFENSNFSKTNNTLLLDPILFNDNTGLTIDICKYFNNTCKFIIKPATPPSTIVDTEIKLVKWEWLNPYYCNESIYIPYSMRIDNGIFDVDPDKDIDHVNDRCFITRLPLYEDCYVFDIYQHTIKKSIKADSLEKYISKYDSVEIICKLNKLKKITIKFTLHYDTPKCILVSPCYMHLNISKTPIYDFETKTNTKVLVYRTKIPITFEQVVNKCNADELKKKVMLSMHDNTWYEKPSIFRSDIAKLTCHNKNSLFYPLTKTSEINGRYNITQSKFLFDLS